MLATFHQDFPKVDLTNQGAILMIQARKAVIRALDTLNDLERCQYLIKLFFTALEDFSYSSENNWDSVDRLGFLIDLYEEKSSLALTELKEYLEIALKELAIGTTLNP